jgi:transketolase
MRIAFVNTVLKVAKKNAKIFLITADLGFSVFEEYMQELPDQFLNIGIAEQNMTGVAAGMAMEGRIPIIYSIVPFSTMRNFEQIRNDICYQNLNVKIVGVGAGFSYGPYGHTHHGLEDIGILRTLPNLTILTPGDPIEAKWATEQALKLKGPVYIRLGRAGEPTVHMPSQKFTIGKNVIVRSFGNSFTIFALSTMLASAVEIAEELNAEDINGTVLSVPTIKPFDSQSVIDAAKKSSVLITLEEHAVYNGLGSAVSEVIAESGNPVNFKRFAVPDRFTKVMGNQEYMRKANALDKESIKERIRELI